MSAVSLAEVIPLVEQLSPEDQLHLIEQVARKLQQRPQTIPQLSWTDARGLGKEVWEGIDVENYINQLRDEW